MGNRLNELKAEQAQVLDIIASLPESAVLDRLSLEARLNALHEAIESATTVASDRTFLMTFRGPPVDSTRGILVDFAGKALQKFSDAFATVAAGRQTTLSDRGRLPARESHLMITGTAIGSFGFQFEGPSDGRLFDDIKTEEMSTLENLISVVRAAAEKDDDDLALALESVQPRAATKIREFVEFVAQQDAGVAFELEAESLVLSDPSKLRTIADRLEHTKSREEVVQVSAELLGVLPVEGTFEARLSDGKVIKGKISDDIVDLEEFSRTWAFEKAQLELFETQIGERPPKYLLIGIEKAGE